MELLLGVAALSAGAGLVHATVVDEHFAEHVAFGWFFVVVAALQLVWPVWLVRRPSAAALTVGLVANAAIIAIWVMSRTTGLPVGPETFEPEAVGAIDGLATVYEVGIVTGCAFFLRRGSPAGPVRFWTGSLRTPVFASVVALVTFGVLLAAGDLQ